MKRSTAYPDYERALSQNGYEVGNFVFTDYFIYKTPGWLPEGYDRESKDQCLQGGGIYNMPLWILFGLKIRFHLVQMRR
jgi:hypothetical protein